MQLDDTLDTHSHKLRLYKSLSEQSLMRKSCQIASKAFIKAMASTKPGSTEHELYATIDYECRIAGAEYLAYPPVVAAGNNANTLHYIDNKQQIKDGDFILVDAGEIIQNVNFDRYCTTIGLFFKLYIFNNTNN